MNKPHSLDIGSDMGHCPVFHDLAILNHLPISAYSGLLNSKKISNDQKLIQSDPISFPQNQKRNN